MNLKHIYDDHVSTDMPFAQLKELCSCFWSDGEKNGYGFFVIDKDRSLQKGKYRKLFDKFAKFVKNKAISIDRAFGVHTNFKGVVNP